MNQDLQANPKLQTGIRIMLTYDGLHPLKMVDLQSLVMLSKKEKRAHLNGLKLEKLALMILKARLIISMKVPNMNLEYVQ